jgi:hypothetical protein
MSPRYLRWLKHSAIRQERADRPSGIRLAALPLWADMDGQGREGRGGYRADCTRPAAQPAGQEEV